MQPQCRCLDCIQPESQRPGMAVQSNTSYADQPMRSVQSECHHLAPFGQRAEAPAVAVQSNTGNADHALCAVPVPSFGLHAARELKTCPGCAEQHQLCGPDHAPVPGAHRPHLHGGLVPLCARLLPDRLRRLDSEAVESHPGKCKWICKANPICLFQVKGDNRFVHKCICTVT